MDTDREIQSLKKLIDSAEGDTLNYLVERLHTLISRREAERRSREPEDHGECTEERDMQPPSLQIKEKHRSLKIVGIDESALKQLYINCDGVRDYVKKCCEYIIDKFTKI
jgi:hypothetical protein